LSSVESAGIEPDQKQIVHAQANILSRRLPIAARKDTGADDQHHRQRRLDQNEL
jgi:hypothetical protein